MTAKRLDVDVDKLVRLYLSGHSVKALSESFRVSGPLVHRRLKERGIKIRNRSQAMFTRMRKTPRKERQRLAANAHEARRGQKDSLSTKKSRAQTKERKRLFDSPLEQRMHRLLEICGLSAIPQQAIGPYNCDLGAYPVAVEILGGHWHTQTRRLAMYRRKTRYLLRNGWSIVFVIHDSRRAPLDVRAAQNIITWRQQLRRAPPAASEYRVIRGTGELVASGGAQDDQISLIPALRLVRDGMTGRYKSVPR